MEEIRVYISEDKLEEDNSLTMKCIGFFQRSKDLKEFKEMLENAGLYGEIAEAKNDAYVKVNSSDHSKPILITSRKKAK